MEDNKQPAYFSPVPPAVPKKPDSYPARKGAHLNEKGN